MTIHVREASTVELGGSRLAQITGRSMGDPGRAAAFLKEKSDAGALVLVACSRSDLVGTLIYEASGSEHGEIVAIASAKEWEGHGVGRALVSSLRARVGHPLIAETDDEALAFYQALGFRIKPLGEKYPGIQRYQCVLGCDGPD